MEISLLRALLNSISRFSLLSSFNSTQQEPVKKYYQNIDEILKLLKPILNDINDSNIAPDEQFNKVLEELDASITEATELVENWHQLTSKVYFVLQIESSMTKIQTSGLEICKLANSLLPSVTEASDSACVQHCVQKIQHIRSEQTSHVIKEAMKDLQQNTTPRSEILMKIADSLSLTTNQELLLEAVALEKSKAKADHNKTNGEKESIDHMISLVTHMHDGLMKIKQSQTINGMPIPTDFRCPLSLELMSDPVIVASGQTYERAFIRKWLDQGLTLCPKTRQTLSHTNLIPNYTVKALIANWCELNNIKLPHPEKSAILNQSPAALAHADGSSGDPRILPHVDHASRINGPRSPESTRSNGTNENDRPVSPLHLNASREGMFVSGLTSGPPSDAGNDLEVDICQVSLSSSKENAGNSEDWKVDHNGQASVSSRKDSCRETLVDEQSSGHSRSASVSSAVSSMDANEASHLSGDLTRYSSDASGELTSEAPPPSVQHRESEFPQKLPDMRSRSQIWRRTPERVVARIVSSPALDTRADLAGIETQVRKLVEDLQSSLVDVQRAAAAELRLLAKHNMDNRIVIATCGAISHLVGLLYSTDLKTQENAVTALLNLSINDNNKIAIANVGAIDPLIHVLETGNPEAKENSAATIFSLSVIEENKVRIGRSHAIKPLVELLGHGTPRGKKDAATALFNLSIFHENKARIVQAGAVKYLVELMDPAAGMVDKAVAVLANLSTIHEGRVAIGQEGGIPVLVEVVELGSARGKENAAAALLQLCTNSNKFCSLVLQEGAVPPLVALSQSGTPRAKEKAQALLSFFRSQRHANAGRA
ncbi:U-box domain-containing protein 4-like isoform X1 [Magnolia sinica]|uniref:U-box domain-containing protein 4-like isoform X1 n=1 Tax=Magnolia sinica TaxID=86752 RepID=UPI00265A43B6|nr:U-box domain-containing protein 4-like isoform X1 [Magnolia sinica]XP_058104161.1 U-box domain-containing protein 4-like isoform X1 [Magnolia sinica]